MPIRPFTRPALGSVELPGSKSITNRALLLAALCDGPVELSGALLSDDTEIMEAALAKLGIRIEIGARGAIRVEGSGGRIPAAAADLFVGNAGTAARFLTALCAAAPAGTYRIDGVPQMRKRPMKGLIEALRALGADIRCAAGEGFLPIEVRAHGLRGGAVSIDASESSQMLSALLMAAPLARHPVSIELTAGVREPFVEMTRRMMASFGGAPSAPGAYRSPGSYAVEPDATAASYFLALSRVTGGSLSFPGLPPAGESLQGDTAFAAVLASIDAAPRDIDFSGFSDTFLTLAAIAPLLDGPTTIRGIGHTRKQETDRVAGMAAELRRLGQEVVETADSLAITPRPLLAGKTVETYGDHRFAMSFAILGCRNLHGDGRPWLSIRDPACCAKTFPGFFGLLESIRTKSLGA
jgi:3-phosphoshikimate 1-carboxyvinyltransferase